VVWTYSPDGAAPVQLMVLGHVLMLLAMPAMMLRRRDEYAGHHHEEVRP
jgi:hypothetical protein